ncbi:MAG: site-2 protease family protein [Candidatus Taylorbacteria bacterium]
MDSNIIFTILILIFSVVIHEVSHGYAALFLGDPTAKFEGRLTLNPLKHLDPVGSVILPIFLALIPPHFVFGWAKPVPYNPYNLRNQRWGSAIVAFAGPLSNLVIAVLFSLLIRFHENITFVPDTFFTLAGGVVLINLILAIFNLVPIPPLDGSKILFAFLPASLDSVRLALEKYGMILVLFFILFLWQFLNPIIFSVFYFLIE